MATDILDETENLSVLNLGDVALPTAGNSSPVFRWRQARFTGRKGSRASRGHANERQPPSTDQPCTDRKRPERRAARRCWHWSDN